MEPALSAPAAPVEARATAQVRPSRPIPVPLVAILIAAGFHAVLGVLVHAVPTLGVVHASLCLIVGLVVAAVRPLRETAYAVAYITGAEVLWRMTKTDVFWEFGKYAVSAILLVALFRVRARRNRTLAIGYFALLLPSSVITLSALGFETARKFLSFNLSGPLALMLCVLFFSNVRLSSRELRGVFVALIIPVVSIWILSYRSTATALDLEFTNASNAVTSGGFSATQVSPILGLGLLFSALLLLERGVPWRIRVPLIISALLFGAQAALTFSRGGLALAFLAMIAAIFYLVRERRTRITLVILATMFTVIGKYVIIPRLQTFTHGKFGERYTSTDSSGRAMLAGYDLEIFVDNPLLGVGPGMASEVRFEMGHGGSAHTEFTRLLSEHGIFGIGAFAMLAALTLRIWRSTRTLRSKAIVTALLVWVTLFFGIYAMRVVAPAFMFGLAASVAYSSLPRPPPRQLKRQAA